MKDNFGIPERRNLDRLKMNYPAIFTRFDEYGTACEQRISKLMNLSLRGVMLESPSPVECGETLDITLALGNNLVTFKGKVVHVTLSEQEGFDLGVSIDDIEEHQRLVLIRFVSTIQTQSGFSQ